MGTLVYNGRTTIAIEDRTLAHLQVVVINKLRRREAFAFTWDDGGNPTVCWMNPSIALEFIYAGNRPPHLNRGWLELMAMTANANSGLVVMPEPMPTMPPGRPHHPDSPEKPRQPRRPTRPTPATQPVREPVSV